MSVHYGGGHERVFTVSGEMSVLYGCGHERVFTVSGDECSQTTGVDMRECSL